MPHPSIESLLNFFACDHLPPRLRAVSEPFSVLAWLLVDPDGMEHEDGDERTHLQGQELTVALRKLLEAKDCAVRAAL